MLQDDDFDDDSDDSDGSDDTSGGSENDSDGSEDDERTGLFGWLFYLVFISALPFSPGMLALSLVRNGTAMSLDVGQMWTFSILANIAIVFGLRAMVTSKEDSAESWGAAASISSRASFAALVVMLICHFGLKLNFPTLVLWWFGINPF